MLYIHVYLYIREYIRRVCVHVHIQQEINRYKNNKSHKLPIWTKDDQPAKEGKERKTTHAAADFVVGIIGMEDETINVNGAKNYYFIVKICKLINFSHIYMIICCAPKVLLGT